MPSIRKTKKRLKREIAELNIQRKIYSCLSKADYIQQHINQLKQELQQLKRKKR